MRLSSNTISAPGANATAVDVDACDDRSVQCPHVPRSFLNARGCTRRAACTRRRYGDDARVHLNESTVRTWWECSGKPIYILSGLRLEDDAATRSPCQINRVRQKEKNLISDIWEKWGRHMWEKGVFGIFGFFCSFWGGTQILRCGKNGVRHMGEMGHSPNRSRAGKSRRENAKTRRRSMATHGARSSPRLTARPPSPPPARSCTTSRW